MRSTVAVMSEPALRYRWSPEGFFRAWDVGAFDRRVELVDGEIWPVIIGDWHGETVGRVIKRLPDEGVKVTTATLPGGAGFPAYWVITREAIFEHSEPIPHGYRTRIEYRGGDVIRVPYTDGVVIAVDDLVAAG